jgi:ABC-type oligopeptide transport system substrate-binding subunit
VIFLVLALFASVSLDSPLPPADLVIIERSDCYTLDPQRMSYQHELRRARVIYETLVNLRARDCEIVPGVAERWEISDDNLTYTFHLRADARWSNGDPVTSRDFAYSWRPGSRRRARSSRRRCREGSRGATSTRSRGSSPGRRSTSGHRPAGGRCR